MALIAIWPNVIIHLTANAEKEKKMNYAKNLKTYKCSNCGLTYQSLSAYLHAVLGIVCNECMDAEVYDSKWA